MTLTPIPYGRHWIDDDDVEAVSEVLRGEWLTTGPNIGRFESRFAETVGAREAVAVSSGTAALHAAMDALGVGPGDEVIVPAMTFAATANAVVYQGGRPVFADVDPETLLLDPADVWAKLSPRTRAIVAVDYAGQPCDYPLLRRVAAIQRVPIVADACHALGASLEGRPVGTLAEITVFSLHPVKHITSGEGGMVTTRHRRIADRIRRFRNHGIDRDAHERQRNRTWYYEMRHLGYNYRLSDLQAALGLSQLGKLSGWLDRRRQIARRYDQALVGNPALEPLDVRLDVEHAWHLYVVRVRSSSGSAARDALLEHLRLRGILANVHYIPVHLHPFYRQRFGTCEGMCPVAEAAYQQILSLPIFPRMQNEDVERVVDALREATAPTTGKARHVA